MTAMCRAPPFLDEHNDERPIAAKILRSVTDLQVYIPAKLVSKCQDSRILTCFFHQEFCETTIRIASVGVKSYDFEFINKTLRNVGFLWLSRGNLSTRRELCAVRSLLCHR